ncbi:MAG: hypothetical protein COB09_02165 [Thalassobium sp.]|nr:MAG: hypothetical protein COB09_02165 [Thalassobium sp.]
MVLRKSGLAAAVLLACSPAAFSDDLNINGFVSVGASVLSNTDVHIGDYDDNASFSNDTIVGLQISKQVNDTTSATAQLVSRGTEDYNTEAAWAYITYAATEDLDVRFGRLRTPFFYYSDFLEVGYAYNWIRPSGEVYRLDTFSSINGVDFTQRFSTGSVDGSVQFYYGRFSDDFTPVDETYNIELRNFTGVVLNLTQGDFGARLSYHQADMYMPELGTKTGALDGLITAATGAGVGDKFVPDGETTSFYEAAVTYDNGDMFFIAEWTALNHETAIFNDDTGYMVSAAKRFDDTTIHLTYSNQSDELESGTVGLIQKNLEGKESSITLGARFDYDTSTAFKVEAQYQDEDTYLGAPGESGMLYSVAVDLVF